MTEKIIEKIF